MDASRERNLAVVSHLGGLVPFLLFPILIPFLVWLFKGDESAFVNEQSREALNFQISLFIYGVISIMLIFTIIGIPIAIVAFIIFIITNIVCSIKGAVRTSKGLNYKYPMNLRLIQ